MQSVSQASKIKSKAPKPRAGTYTKPSQTRKKLWEAGYSIKPNKPSNTELYEKYQKDSENSKSMAVRSKKVPSDLMFNDYQWLHEVETTNYQPPWILEPSSSTPLSSASNKQPKPKHPILTPNICIRFPAQIPDSCPDYPPLYLDEVPDSEPETIIPSLK